MKVEEYKKHLFHPKTDKYALIGHLKQEGSIENILKLYKGIHQHPFLKSIVKANVKPLEYSGIRNSRPAPFSGSLHGELAWTYIVVDENQDLLKEFIKLKLQFEDQMLLCNYDEAQRILDFIEKQTGKSIWLIENTLILNEYQIGVKANWNTVSELSKLVQDPLLLFFIENLSKRTESKISFARYRNLFNNQLNEILVNELFEYLCFRLNYTAYNDYESLAYFIFVESSSSIIDRYILLRNILVELFAPKFQDFHNLIFEMSEKLQKLFKQDIIWQQINSFSSHEIFSNIITDNRVLNLIDKYCAGDYETCISESKELIKEFPSCIEIYDIYVKSLIEAERDYENTQISNTIDSILEIIHNIYSNSTNLEQSIDAGYKLTTTFSSASWARQLQSFLIASTNSNSTNKLFTLSYILFSHIRNPRILYYVKEGSNVKYSDYFNKDVPGNLTVSLISRIINAEVELIKTDSFISKRKLRLYVGRTLMRSKEYHGAKELYESLISDASLSTISHEEIIVNLYRCYIKLGLIERACNLFVSNYLSNRQLIKRLDKLKLLYILESIDLNSFNSLIEVPIFYKIASDDPYQQYVAYDNYLERCNATRPTEILSKDISFTNQTIFFLREVCTIEVMHHSYHFNGTDDIEEERLSILNNLIVIDKEYEEDYIKEIAELSQKANIRKAIREVNKARISVNVQQLKNIESSTIKEAFTRYKEIENYSKMNHLVGIDTSLNILDEVNRTLYDELVTNKIIYTNDPAFISFKVIFIEIRDKFLFSKEYGLDGYLSTRIRHGTLLNHIRSIFESQNIISQRDKSDNYLDNDFWNNNIPYYLSDKKENIQTAIKRFSKSIDEYTEYIVKQLVQIKTEKHNKKPNGLFDFSMGNSELAVLFTIVRENIKDHNVFIGFVFEYLQDFTEKTLTGIREYLTNDIKENYNKLLQDFSIEIKDILGNATFPELISSINFCGTRLQKEIETISEWFYLSGASKDLVLDLNVLVQTSVQITNTIYPNYRISPTITENYDFPMVGTVHLIYICRILLDNIIIHSKLDPSELKIDIQCTVTEDEYLKLSFKNNFSSEINTTELIQKLDLVKQKWESSNNNFENIDVEGGSGFDKIGRIIAFDLACDRYGFKYQVSNYELTISLYIDFLNVPKYDELKNDSN